MPFLQLNVAHNKGMFKILLLMLCAIIADSSKVTKDVEHKAWPKKEIVLWQNKHVVDDSKVMKDVEHKVWPKKKIIKRTKKTKQKNKRNSAAQWPDICTPNGTYDKCHLLTHPNLMSCKSSVDGSTFNGCCPNGVTEGIPHTGTTCSAFNGDDVPPKDDTPVGGSKDDIPVGGSKDEENSYYNKCYATGYLSDKCVHHHHPHLMSCKDSLNNSTFNGCCPDGVTKSEGMTCAGPGTVSAGTTLSVVFVAGVAAIGTVVASSL